MLGGEHSEFSLGVQLDGTTAGASASDDADADADADVVNTNTNAETDDDGDLAASEGDSGAADGGAAAADGGHSLLFYGPYNVEKLADEDALILFEVQR